MTDAPPRGGDGVDGPREEAEGELALARIALADNDLQHAAHHLAAAIELAPGVPEAHELLAALAARTPDGGLSLFPLDGEQRRLGDIVAHAYLIGPRDPDSALVMLASATGFRPDQAVGRHGVAAGAGRRRVQPRCARPGVRQGDARAADPDARRAAAGQLRLFRPGPAGGAGVPGARAGARHGRRIARRLGPLSDAVRWGERAFQLEPGKLTAVWYAYALKAAGRLDEALAVMTEAQRSNPFDLDLSSDIASWLTAAGRLDEALEVIEAAMAVDPTYDCAVHTAHRLRFLRDGDARHLVALADFMRETPPSTHDHSDLADCCEDRDWLGQPAAATEACVNTLYQIPDVQRATAAVHEVLRGRAGGAQRRGRPAPAVPRHRDRYRRPRAGRHDRGPACPAVHCGGTTGSSRRPAYRRRRRAAPRCWPTSRRACGRTRWPPTAMRCRCGELPAADLRALLVHPPARPDSWSGDTFGVWWVRSAQVFACLGLLHCEEAGDPAARRALLAEIAWGVEDWTTEAALFALVTAAWVDPSCRDEVAAVVGDRFVAALRASRDRVVTILGSLAILVRITPQIAPRPLEAGRPRSVRCGRRGRAAARAARPLRAGAAPVAVRTGETPAAPMRLTPRTLRWLSLPSAWPRRDDGVDVLVEPLHLALDLRRRAALGSGGRLVVIGRPALRQLFVFLAGWKKPAALAWHGREACVSWRRHTTAMGSQAILLMWIVAGQMSSPNEYPTSTPCDRSE